MLKFAPQAASEQVYKVLASAVANAENNERLDPDSLLVRAAYVDEGPTLKRFRPRAQGRAYRIRKRTCHITIEVESVIAVRRRAAGRPRRPRPRRRPPGQGGRRPTEAEPTTSRRPRPRRRRRPRRPPAKKAGQGGRPKTAAEAGRDAKKPAKKAAKKAGGQAERRPSNGSEGSPDRVPARHLHRLEVALVRGQALQGLHRRGRQDPQADVQGPGARRHLQGGHRAHPRPGPHRHPHRPAGHRHRPQGRRGRPHPRRAGEAHRQAGAAEHPRGEEPRVGRAARRPGAWPSSSRAGSASAAPCARRCSRR